MGKLSYKLEVFEGPLDLMLFLIQKNKLNIYDVKLSILIEQYLEHVTAMQLNNMDIASDFLEMAARLIYLKTISLLPKHDEAEGLKEELQIELMEYEKCRRLAMKMASMTEGFNTFVKPCERIELDKTYLLTHESEILVSHYLSAVGRGRRKLPPPTTVFRQIVAKNLVSVSSKIIYVLRNLWRGGRHKMSVLFKSAESRSEIVATFLAVLELCKANRVEITGDGEDMEIIVNKERKKFE